MGKIKHVTIVGPLPPPAGGMANQTRKLAEFLRSEQVEVNVIQVNSAYWPKFIGGIPVIRAIFRLFQYIFTLLRQLPNTDLVHVMANSGWSWHLFAVPAIWIARLYRKPVVINYRGGYARDFFNKSWFWVKKSVDRSSSVIVPSSFLQGVFAEFSVKADIVPNVLDENLFHSLNRAEAVYSPHIIVTRNLELIYDVETAILAFCKIKEKYAEARLSIAGTGPELNNLKQLVLKLKLTNDVYFTGRLEPSEMAELYRSADIMINTSRVDNTPNSIIESLACGTAVISTNVGGIPNLVTHEYDALLVDPGDCEAIANYAAELLDDKEKYHGIVENGLKTISQFHWRNVWSKLQHVYVNATKNATVNATKNS